MTAEHQDWLRTQPGMQPELQLALGLLGISPYQYFDPTTVVTPGQQGLLQQALQGAGPLMMGLGMMGVSDKRLKKNLIKIGFIKNIPIYLFQYIWNNTKWYIGTVAQEIINKYPNTIIKIGKYLAIDYKRLIEEM